MEGEQDKAATDPSRQPQRWSGGSASLGLGLCVYGCKGASCKPARSRNKTPRHRGRDSRLLHVPGSGRVGEGGGALIKQQGGGSGSSQQVDRQPAVGQGLSSWSCQKTRCRHGPAPGSQRPLARGGRFGVAGVTPACEPGCSLCRGGRTGCHWERVVTRSVCPQAGHGAGAARTGGTEGPAHPGCPGRVWADRGSEAPGVRGDTRPLAPTFARLPVGLEHEAHGAAAVHARGRVVTLAVAAPVVHSACLCTERGEKGRGVEKAGDHATQTTPRHPDTPTPQPGRGRGCKSPCRAHQNHPWLSCSCKEVMEPPS